MGIVLGYTAVILAVFLSPVIALWVGNRVADYTAATKARRDEARRTEAGEAGE